MRFSVSLVSIVVAVSLTPGCTDPSQSQKKTWETAQSATPSVVRDRIDAEVAQEERDQQANALFDEIFLEQIKRSPIFQTYLGIKDDYDKWDDLSEAFQAESQDLRKQDLEKLLALNAEQLSPQVRLSHTLLKQMLEEQIEDFRWRYHSYPVNQMYGYHSMVPSMLINQHKLAKVNVGWEPCQK